MKNLLRKILSPFIRPETISRYLVVKSSEAVPPRLWSQIAPYIKQQYARFDNSTFLLGECVICGHPSSFFTKINSVPRESLLCAVCLTTSRYRSIARGILRAFKEISGVTAPSLARLSASTLTSPLRIYDTQMPFYYLTCCYPIPDLLTAIPNVEVHFSRYLPQEEPGKKLSNQVNLTNQNLERLTFPDAFFDIVITSDVMEHVRIDSLAHSEIRRVLKPGGVYIFTVPHTRAVSETLHRVVIHDPLDSNKDEFVLEKEFHGDANSPEDAALCYRVYGTELDEILTQVGFIVEYTQQDFPEAGILSTELFYCRVGTTDSPSRIS